MSYENSQADGLPLPRLWQMWSPLQRGLIIRMLNADDRHDPDYRDAMRNYFRLSSHQRSRVKAHLQIVGSVRARTMPLTTPNHDVDNAGRPRVVVPVGGMLYPSPNGGNRILPPIYTKLKTWWLRATGHRQEIETMNDGHLENSLKLLHESTGNLLGKCNLLLGKMHAHMGTQPEIQRRLEELSLLIGALDVDDVYPIYGQLASELSMRQQPVVMMDIETTASDIDAAIGNW